MLTEKVKKILSYTNIEKLKQGKSCVVFLHGAFAYKFYYDHRDCIMSFVNQCKLIAKDLATLTQSVPQQIKINIGGQWLDFWYYICDRAAPVNNKLKIKLIKLKLERAFPNTYWDLYDLNNIGIYNGKLVLVDTLP